MEEPRENIPGIGEEPEKKPGERRAGGKRGMKGRKGMLDATLACSLKA